jgi:hypothetical protein
MSESFKDKDPAEETARRAVFYPDLETATSSFAMESATRMIIESMESGEPLDIERLGHLVETMDVPPTSYTELKEDGTMVDIVDGIEVRRIPPSE